MKATQKAKQLSPLSLNNIPTAPVRRFLLWLRCCHESAAGKRKQFLPSYSYVFEGFMPGNALVKMLCWPFLVSGTTHSGDIHSPATL